MLDKGAVIDWGVESRTSRRISHVGISLDELTRVKECESCVDSHAVNAVKIKHALRDAACPKIPADVIGLAMEKIDVMIFNKFSGTVDSIVGQWRPARAWDIDAPGLDYISIHRNHCVCSLEYRRSCV